MNEYLELFLLFVKIGALTFGGGYAMLPLLKKELVYKRNWVTKEELLDYFTVGQCTPGIIAINVSTFIGNKRKGVVGAIIATSGFILIPFIIILSVASFLHIFESYKIIKHAFFGIHIAVFILVLHAIIALWDSSIVDKKSFAIFVFVLLVSLFSHLSPSLIIILIGIISLIYHFLTGGHKQ